jgi:hypothetical protein
MRTISGSELNEMLVDTASLLDVCYDAASRQATLRFKWEDDVGRKPDVVTVHCTGVFQIILQTFHEKGLVKLGIDESAGLETIIPIFRDQYVFEWELDCDTVTRPLKPWPASLQLLNLPPPPEPHRGIAVFKDTDEHFQLLIIGTGLFLVE